MEKIDSLQNARVKKWASLHHKKNRDETGLFLIEGEHLIQEALKENAVEMILTDGEDPFSFENTILVTSAILKKLSSNISQVHLIAVCRQRKREVEEYHRLLLLDDVQDPGNLGTLIRTAVSFSFDGVILSENCCDLYNEKTIRSTQGAFFHVPVIRENLFSYVSRLQQQKVKVIATALENGVPMEQIPACDSMAFILGNEGNGVSKELQDKADQRLFIEMHGFESLNVAVAGGILMYHYRVR